MPELPELTVWARQARRELRGKVVAGVEVRQPKCLNVSPETMSRLLTGRTVLDAYERGKWLVLDLGTGVEPAAGAGLGAGAGPAAEVHLLINLGMGGDFHYAPAPGAKVKGPAGLAAPSAAPGKYQFKLSFTDGAELALSFWWFGYVHAVEAGELDRHAMTATLGPSPLDPDLDFERFRAMVAARPRRSVKSFLLDQKNLAGIGNVYVQDTLWGARLHPDRLLGSLAEAEVRALWEAMRHVLERAIAKGGLAYERDFYGRPGGLENADFDVGYKTGKPCPRCGTAVVKIRTGSTSTYICPECQKK